MQKNLSGVKHLRLTSSDEDLMSDLYHGDEDTGRTISTLVHGSSIFARLGEQNA